jgi:hypothetical protein
LNKAVAKLLDVELAKSPSSEQSIQLSKIALASRYGLNYFTSVIEDTNYPNYSDWILSQVLTSNKLGLCAISLITAYIGVSILDCVTPSVAYYLIASKYYSTYSQSIINQLSLRKIFQVSLMAFVLFHTIRDSKVDFKIKLTQKQEDLKSIFENAIAPEKAITNTPIEI